MGAHLATLESFTRSAACRPHLTENRMKKSLTALLATATIATSMAAFATDASAQNWHRHGRGGNWVGPAIVGGLVGGIALGAIMSNRPRGYVAYEGYGRPVYGDGCYWAAEPVYDRRGRVVGYTNQPVQVCPGYRPY
jgi:hypothetical protein